MKTLFMAFLFSSSVFAAKPFVPPQISPGELFVPTVSCKDRDRKAEFTITGSLENFGAINILSYQYEQGFQKRFLNEVCWDRSPVSEDQVHYRILTLRKYPIEKNIIKILDVKLNEFESMRFDISVNPYTHEISSAQVAVDGYINHKRAVRITPLDCHSIEHVVIPGLTDHLQKNYAKSKAKECLKKGYRGVHP